MSVQPTEVKFFKSLSCTGDSSSYFEGDTIALPFIASNPDKYLSCIIGSDIWINAYENNDAFNPDIGAHERLESGTHNDLSYLNGVTKFQVLSKSNSFAIDIKLTDKTSAAKGSYLLTMVPEPSLAVSVLSGSPYTQYKTASPSENGTYEIAIHPEHTHATKSFSGSAFIPVPVKKLANSPNSEISCRFNVKRTEWPHQYVAKGSINFVYNPSNGVLTLNKTQFPINMDVVQVGKTDFIFGLHSLDITYE
eukprot:gene22462-26940_t